METGMKLHGCPRTKGSETDGWGGGAGECGLGFGVGKFPWWRPFWGPVINRDEVVVRGKA